MTCSTSYCIVTVSGTYGMYVCVHVCMYVAEVLLCRWNTKLCDREATDGWVFYHRRPRVLTLLTANNVITFYTIARLCLDSTYISGGYASLYLQHVCNKSVVFRSCL